MLGKTRALYWTLALQLLVTPFVAQKEATNWYFGSSTGITFSANPPQLIAIPPLFTRTYQSSAISDSSGQVVFYSTEYLYSKTNSLVPSSQPLNINGSAGDILIKKPGSGTFFYRLRLQSGLRYDVIDLAAGSTGSVVSVNNILSSNIPTNNNGIAATKHCNGVDYWIVVQNISANIFYAFLMNSGGIISSPVTSTVGSTHLPSNFGQLKFSPNGKFLATAVYSNSNGVFSHFELFNFNRSTGVISNCVLLNYFPNLFFNAYGVEFSPDNSKLYGSYIGSGGGKIFQWDLCAGSSTAIASSAFTVSSTTSAKYNMQLGLDGRIYIARIPQGSGSSTMLAVIGNPNLQGSACNYMENGFSLGAGSVYYGLVNFPANYFNAPLAPISFSLNLQSSCRSVTFTAPPNFQCSSSSYSLVNAVWSFGDPNSGSANFATGTNAVHEFSGPGSYPVKVKLIYDCGSDSSFITVPIEGPSYSILSSAATCSTTGSASVAISNGIGPFNYSWSPSGNNSSNPSTLSPGLHIVKIYDSGAQCLNTATVNINSNYSMSAAVSVTNLSCYNSNNGAASATVTGGSGSYTYSWTNTSQTNSLATNLAAGVYTVIVNDLNGPCSASQIFSILAPDLLNTSIQAATVSACVNESILLNSNVTGGVPPYSYSWTNGASTASTTVTSTISGNFSHLCVATDANGCSGADNLMLTFLSAPHFSVSSATVCLGDNVTLLAAGVSSATWMPPGFVGTSAVFHPSSSSNYTVFGIPIGCLSTHSSVCTVSLVPRPIVLLSLSSNSICSRADYGSLQTLTLQLSGTTAYSVTTSAGLFCSSPNSTTSIISSNIYDADTAKISVAGSNGYCTTFVSKEIKVIPSPTVHVNWDLQSQCIPYCPAVTLTCSDDVEKRNSFMLSSGRNTQIDYRNFCVTKTGNHMFSITVANAVGCYAEYSKELFAYPKPVAAFTWIPEKPTELLDQVYFQAQANETLKYHWEYVIDKGIERNNMQTFTTTFSKAGYHPIVLIVENDFYCRDTLISYVEVQEDLALYVPNAFTPNGDGKNDILLPVVRGIHQVNFDVYDRWGELLFTTDDIAVGWDGTYKGTDCREGQYVWQVRIKGSETEIQPLHRTRTGTVLLYR